jgi:hypothetical protein
MVLGFIEFFWNAYVTLKTKNIQDRLKQSGLLRIRLNLLFDNCDRIVSDLFNNNVSDTLIGCY